MQIEQIEEVVQRALVITNSVRQRRDERAFESIEAYKGPLDYAKSLRDLGISNAAWLHVKQVEIDARFVFAHPTLLIEHPHTSLYYRGLSTLSLKRVQQLAGSVDTWEKSDTKAKVTPDRARRIAHLYNSVISSLLDKLPDWTLKDGHRNIVATMGIGIDGTVRNLIGQNAEKNVRRLIVDWLSKEAGIPHKQDGTTKSRWLLGEGRDVLMEFSSEPDIGFYRRADDGDADTWQQTATIEIKGGTDPAGALERLGAIKKSFDITPPQCKNFLVLGVVTPRMADEMKEMHVERHFSLAQILSDIGHRDAFLNEIFHHALRILDAPFGSGKRLQVDAYESGAKLGLIPSAEL